MSSGRKFIALCILAALIVTGMALTSMSQYDGESNTEVSSDSDGSKGPDGAGSQGATAESGDLDRVKDQDRTKRDMVHGLGQT